MNIKLTKEQKKHLKSIRWLFMGPRRTGRTTLLAYVLIETALMTGQKMRIFDHHQSTGADRLMCLLISKIIEDNNLPLKVDRTGMYLIKKYA